MAAASVRVAGLGPVGLNFDDAWVVVGSASNPWWEIPRRGLGAGGFALLLRPFLEIFGDRVVGAQAPAFLASCSITLGTRRSRFPPSVTPDNRARSS